MCVIAIIRISQYNFREFCAILLPRLVLEETASSTSLTQTDIIFDSFFHQKRLLARRPVASSGPASQYTNTVYQYWPWAGDVSNS